MTTLVTGASGGLGAEFARLAARDRSDLVLVARRVDVLESLAQELLHHGVSVTVIAADLTHEGAVETIVETLAQKHITVDTLIANAGVGQLTDFSQQDPKDIEQMLRLNIESLTLIIRRILPQMKSRGSGSILTVASTAAYTPGPLMAVYYASKAYVLSFSVALRNELRDSGVSVTCLCPGPTRTGFQEAAGMANAPMFKKFHTMDSAAVAHIGYRGMQKKKAIVIAGWSNKVSAFLTRLVPKTFTAKVARRAQE